MKTPFVLAMFATFSLLTACGKSRTVESVEAELLEMTRTVCACTTQKCAQDALEHRDQLQQEYGELAKGNIPQRVVDDYLKRDQCYQDINSGKH
jgi:hypothetical protein